MKNWFKSPVDGNWFKKLLTRFNNWRIDRMFSCPVCKKGELVNLHGYFECTKCGHEFK